MSHSNRKWHYFRGAGPDNTFGQLGDGGGQVSSVPERINNGGLSINYGAEYTNNSNVSLVINARAKPGSRIDYMEFSNDGENWSGPLSYSTVSSWILTSGDGPKTVYAKFQDGQGIWSPIYSASIILDTTPPVVSITSPVAGVTGSMTPMLTYTVSDGSVVVTADGTVVSKVSGDTLDALDNRDHTVRVEATDEAGNKGVAEVTFTVAATKPTVSILSPIAGTTNLTSVPLIYNVDKGSVTITLDGGIINAVSEDTIDGLVNGDHNIRVEAKDNYGNIGFAEVAFTVDTSAPDNDDTNIYCKGTGTYMVGPSSFTSGISIPSANNDVQIASPYNGATITGPRAIVKGAMDTTVPVNGVLVVVTSSTGTAGYPAQVNGKYFAAQVPVTTDITTISAIATDQTGSRHQMSVNVTATDQPDNISVTAAPSTGIPTVKSNGKTTLDVSLLSTATMPNPVTSYAWDFSGSGSADMTCTSHSDIKASYQQTGLYLSNVTVTDSKGGWYKDTAIVNVLDRNEIDSQFQAIWNGMKTALINNDTATALTYIASHNKQKFSDVFTALQSSISPLATKFQGIELITINDTIAKYRIKREQVVDGQNRTITYYIYIMLDQDGQWKIADF